MAIQRFNKQKEANSVTRPCGARNIFLGCYEAAKYDSLQRCQSTAEPHSLILPVCPVVQELRVNRSMKLEIITWCWWINKQIMNVHNLSCRYLTM